MTHTMSSFVDAIEAAPVHFPLFPDNLEDYALESLVDILKEAAEVIIETALVDAKGDRWPDHDVVDEYLRHIDECVDFARSIVPNRLFLKPFAIDNGKPVRTAHTLIRFAIDWINPTHGDAHDVAGDFTDAAKMIDELRQDFAKSEGH